MDTGDLSGAPSVSCASVGGLWPEEEKGLLKDRPLDPKANRHFGRRRGSARSVSFRANKSCFSCFRSCRETADSRSGCRSGPHRIAEVFNRPASLPKLS